MKNRMGFELQNPDGTGQPGGGTPDPATVGAENQQPAKAEPGKGQPGSTAQPEKSGEGSLTLDTLRQVIKEVTPAIVREETAKAFQGVQKMTSRMEERVRSDFQQQIAELKKSGISPTEEQQRALLENTRERVLSEAEKSGQTTPDSAKSQEAQEGKSQEHPAVTVARSMIQAAGLQGIDKESPAFALIDQKTDDPKVFLDSVQKAIDHEKARLQTKTNTLARNPSIAVGVGKGSGSGIANNNDINELYKQGFGTGT